MRMIRSISPMKMILFGFVVGFIGYIRPLFGFALVLIGFAKDLFGFTLVLFRFTHKKEIVVQILT